MDTSNKPKRGRGRPALPVGQKKENPGRPLVQCRVDPEVADFVHNKGAEWHRALLTREYRQARGGLVL